MNDENDPDLTGDEVTRLINELHHVLRHEPPRRAYAAMAGVVGMWMGGFHEDAQAEDQLQKFVEVVRRITPGARVLWAAIERDLDEPDL